MLRRCFFSATILAIVTFSLASHAQSLGALARQHCLGQFSQEPVVDQILTYYRFVLTHDQPTPPRTALPCPAGAAPLLSVAGVS